MPRDCDCSGGGPCGPGSSDDDGVTRRGFLTLIGAGAAGTLLAGPAFAEAQKKAEAELAAWKRDVRKSTPRRYFSDVHTDARFPLGGIGTGNIELGADGQLTTWQLFNTLRDGYVPFFFGVRAGKSAKLLQTTGGPPDLPRVKRIEMTGEYPVAVLRFEDPDLPVHLEMSAFTPFSPLDTPVSSLPVACFVFRIHNPTSVQQTVSLAALMQNPVGYDAMGQTQSFNSVGFNTPERRLDGRHPNFGGNVNEASRDGGKTTLLSFRAEPGDAGTLDKPVHLHTNLPVSAFNASPGDLPQTLTVDGLDRLPAHANGADADRVLIWLEAAGLDVPERALVAARDAVRAGATLVFSGSSMPLLQAFADATGGKPLDTARLAPDILFEDFETGYDRWTVTGDAFGTAPAQGTLPNQQNVSGFRGQRLVNSFAGGDDTTGRMTSRPFTIERNYIRFLVGGGRHATTQIRLVVDGKTVRAQSGKDNERLDPAFWDVREWKGRSAHIEIVDEQQGAWGHINVDHIEFADAPISHRVLVVLEELLPARFAAVRTEKGRPVFENLLPRQGATVQPVAAAAAGGEMRSLVTQPIGRGRVTLAQGPILDAPEVELVGARRQAIRLLAPLIGARYDAPLGVPPEAPGFGTLALAVTGQAASSVSALPAFTDWKAAWKTFADKGQFMPLTNATTPPTPTGETVNGALAASVTIAPGKTVEVPFFLGWRYPNKRSGAGVPMGNHYATRWPDATAVVRDVARNFPNLRARTERFRKTFYDSTLPYYLLDCLTSQISTIRHIGVVFRIANGDIYGWEGSNGCCPPTCTHVWGYEQTLARLFPDLERDMRRIDFKHQQRPDGGVNNRTEVPSPPRPTGEHPFSDGHASTILKAYREALNTDDSSYLKEYWPHVKRAMEYLITRDASGGTPDGTLSDDQWNTYDNAIHGVNSFIGGYYLAALRAGEEWARRIGDTPSADRFHAIFEKGRGKLVELCWNGEYFQQHLPGYENRAGEYGPGCLSDQILGQWWAHQLDLGYLLPPEQVRSALRAVVKHNWRTDFTNFRHNWRKFAGGSDKGLLICTWPRGGRPRSTIPYVDEVWTGVEYQVAAHLIYEGMVDEAFAIVKGARDRYDGIPRPPMPRSPWNEIECGGHYARALSSWSLLSALSGFACDGPAKTVRFAPRVTPDNFKSFFTGPECWGSLRQTRRGSSQQNEIGLVEGRLSIAELHLTPARFPEQVRVTVNGRPIPATFRPASDGVLIALATPYNLTPGETLKVRLSQRERTIE